MANRFYAEGESRARRVDELFDRIAPRYDLINDVQSFGMHRLWKRRMVALADAKPGSSALDVCCGTGDVTFALARNGANAVGVDFNAAMLRVAVERCSRLQTRSSSRTATPVGFIRADALQLPFRDERFDAVTIAYGLRNLASFDRGLSEMLRVLRPRGRLVILDFGKPERPVWRKAYFAYLRRMVPFYGRWFCGNADAYAYILESLDHYPAQRGIAAKLGELGCSDVRIIDLLGGVMSIHCATKRS